MRPAPRSLVLDLLSTLRSGSMPVRALVAAGALFGIDGNGVRVALARLLVSGLVERDERGLYRLGGSATAVNEQVRSWRAVEDRLRSWDGAWVGVSTATLARADRRANRRRERALRLLGFRPLERSLDVRPDNLAGGVSAVRERLSALGLDSGARVFRLDQLDPESEAGARGLWDAVALRSSYRELRRQLAESERRLPRLAAEEAMRESFLLGGRAIRTIVLDPLLPEPMVPAAERSAVVEAMRRYDRLGRACWAPLLRSFGVPHRHAPADLNRHVADAAGGLA